MAHTWWPVRLRKRGQARVPQLPVLTGPGLSLTPSSPVLVSRSCGHSFCVPPYLPVSRKGLCLRCSQAQCSETPGRAQARCPPQLSMHLSDTRSSLLCGSITTMVIRPCLPLVHAVLLPSSRPCPQTLLPTPSTK